MNRFFTLLLLLFGVLSISFSQIPQQFNFQGVARDNGTIITGSISLQISIHQGTPNGPVAFRERHFTVTNSAGVFNVLIGQGLPVTGTIGSIDWTNGLLYIQTELDPTGGLSFTDMGTVPVASVPYALYARETELDAVDDADADPTNEIQQLTFNPVNNELSISSGNAVTIPTGGTDADADPTNELQALSQNGNLVTLSLGGGTIDITDADGNPGNELQNLSWNQTTSQLGISLGNTVDLSSLAANASPWKSDPFGLYYDQGDVYVGNPNITPSLHLAPTFLDFHTGMPYYSFYDPFQISFTGEIFSSVMKNNRVQIEGAWIDSYWNNRMDSTGFYADYWGIIPGQTVQDGYGFEARPDIGVTTSFGRLQQDNLEIRNMNTYARLEKNNLTFGAEGLGPYGIFSGNGKGSLSLFNGANWIGYYATATNDGGYLLTYDPTGQVNADLGYLNNSNPASGALRLYSQGNDLVYVGEGIQGSGGIWNQGPNGMINTAVTYLNGVPNHGFIYVADGNGNQQAGMYVDASGNGTIFADGANGGVKSFVMQHPERSDTDIWYASLEGPEAAAYERGVASLKNGEAFVPFSDHFRVVANAETMTVILTPHAIDTYGLAVVSKTDQGFTVRELKGETGNFSFDWEVKCVRKGWESWQVERAHDSHKGGQKPTSSSRRGSN